MWLLDTGSTFALSSAELYNPDNAAPVARPSAVTTPEDDGISMELPVTDPDGDALTYTVVSPPAHGTYSFFLSYLVYTPAADFHGTDSFTFKASDGVLESDVVTVSLTVTPVNDAPRAQDLSKTASVDTEVPVVLAATDAEGDALTYTVVTPPAHGTLSGTAPDLTYTPNPDFSGTDSFTFKAHDGKLDSNVATVSLSLTAETAGCGGCSGASSAGASGVWGLALLLLGLVSRRRVGSSR